MAEPLKHMYGLHVSEWIADRLLMVDTAFDKPSFMRAVAKGYEALALLPRAWHMADQLKRFLPSEYERAAQVIMDSLGEPLDQTETFGFEVFKYLPFVFFVAKYGVEEPAHFDLSMKLQYELTQRFSAEFSIRPFIEAYPEKTLAQLHLWTSDKNPHVRRLVSEGTRPRLPWASRLKMFDQDPSPTLALLEKLKDDEDLYVRRSVANHLNDIGKKYPDLLISTAKDWLVDASPQREWLVKHALRSAVKQGNPNALKLLGFAEVERLIQVSNKKLSHQQIQLGNELIFSATIHNTHDQPITLLVDYVVHYVKANQQLSQKVFKLTEQTLNAGELVHLQKKHAFRNMTTRTHYAGRHHIDLQINGVQEKLGSFDLVMPE